MVSGGARSFITLEFLFAILRPFLFCLSFSFDTNFRFSKFSAIVLYGFFELIRSYEVNHLVERMFSLAYLP